MFSEQILLVLIGTCVDSKIPHEPIARSNLARLYAHGEEQVEGASQPGASQFHKLRLPFCLGATNIDFLFLLFHLS